MARGIAQENLPDGVLAVLLEDAAAIPRKEQGVFGRRARAQLRIIFDSETIEDVPGMLTQIGAVLPTLTDDVKARRAAALQEEIRVLEERLARKQDALDALNQS